MSNSVPEILSQEAVAALSFEDAYARLEQVVAFIERGDLPLEQALALYEYGVRLADHCAQKLEQAELQVRQWRSREETLESLDTWTEI